MRERVIRLGRVCAPALALFALVLVSGKIPLADSADTGCSSRTIGVDTSLANYYFVAFVGRTYFQSFVAEDTLVRSVSVWRRAEEDTNFTPLRAYIVGVDSTGRPRAHLLIAEGPTLTIPYSDGITPTKFEFVFDPPVVLPRRGVYAFGIKEALCAGTTLLLADSTDGFPEGRTWKAPPNFECFIDRPDDLPPRHDFVFELEFCRREEAQIEGQTWGRIKSIYR